MAKGEVDFALRSVAAVGRFARNLPHVSQVLELARVRVVPVDLSHPAPLAFEAEAEIDLIVVAESDAPNRVVLWMFRELHGFPLARVEWIERHRDSPAQCSGSPHWV